MPRGLALNGKKLLYRTTDWAWKGFAGIKNTMRNTPLTPQPNPQPNPQTTPPINKTPQITLPNPLVVASSSRKALATIKSHFFPSSWYKKPLKPRCLAIVRLRPTESTALAMKESHLFPTWWANPQKTSETSVFGNSAGFDLMKAQLLQWKRATSSQHDEPTHKKPLKPVCLAIARLRPTESTALAMKEGHLFPTWWANPQKTSETSVFGNSAVSTYWKHSPCTDRGCLLSNYVVVVVVVVVVIVVVVVVVAAAVVVVAVVVYSCCCSTL